MGNKNNFAWGFNAIVFLATTVCVVVLSWSVLDDFLPVRRSLHAYENHMGGVSSGMSTFPHSYATLDWIMTPELDHEGNPIITKVQKDTCWQDENLAYTTTDSKSCAPEYWQSADFCPYPGELYSDWSARIAGNVTNTGAEAVTQTNIEKQLAWDEKEKQLGPYPCTSDTSKICYAMPQVRDACRVERLGSFAVMANDGLSWSLASGHNADLLYQGAAVILWLISGFHLINAQFPITADIVGKNEYVVEERFEKQKMYKRLLGLLAALYFIIVRTFFTAHDTVQGDKVYAHLLPNASYFYILLSIIWITIFGSMDSVFCHLMQITAATKGQTAEHDSLNDAVYVADIVTDKPPSENQPALAQFNLSGFSTGKKLDAYLPRLAPLKGAGTTLLTSEEAYDEEKVVRSNDFNFDEELLHNSCVKFEVVQLFTLPLLLLAITVRYNSWEIDSKLQLLYLAGFGYALFDVARNRVHYTCRVFDRVINKSSVDASSTFKGKDPVKSAMRIIELLCVLLQVLVFFVIFNTWIEHISARRAAIALSGSNGREMHMDFSIWSFLVYGVVAALLKVVQIWVPMDGQYMRYVHSKNVLYVCFVIFVLLSIGYALITRDNMIFSEHRNFLSEDFFKHMTENDKEDIYSRYGRWSNSWVLVNSM